MMPIFIILPNQLYDKLPKGMSEYFLVEHPVFFTMYKYHKAKLIMHRYTMKLYNKKFPQCKYANYIELFKKYKNISCYDPVDHYVSNDFNNLAKKYKVTLTYLSSPGWIDGSLEYTGGRVQTNFYRWQRKRLKLFTNKMNPLTYDKQNRKPFDSLELVDNHVEVEHNDKEYLSAVKYVNKHFPNNPGKPIYWLPGDHSGALKHLHNFFKYRFKQFGPYEDAIHPDVLFGFHSVISPLLNIGLLTPNQIIKEVLSVYKSYPFNSVEGFIRQIVGWREYCRLIYCQDGPQYGNRFNATKPLPKYWYSHGDIEIIDQLVTKVWEYGYLHHIERLMIISNYMTFMQFKPSDCYDWFMSAFLDSYHVFMETNLYGMSMNVIDKTKKYKCPYKLPTNWDIYKLPKGPKTYMTNKLYICSSNYIKKMGWKLSPEDAKIFDDHYHSFIKKHLNKSIRYFPGGISTK